MKKSESFLIIIFLVIIFSALPAFMFGNNEESAIAVENYKKARDFSNKPFGQTLNIIEEQQVRVENRLMAKFPFYEKIVISNRDLDLWLNSFITPSKDGENFSSVGNTTLIPVWMNKAEDLLIWNIDMGTREEKDEMLEKQIIKYNSLADTFPMVNFSIYAVADIWHSEAGKEAGLGDMAGEDYLKRMEKQLNSNIGFDWLEIDNMDAYRRMFFKTDHHWNIFGAYEGYLEMYTLLSQKTKIGNPVPGGNYFQVEGVEFKGSRAKQAALTAVTDELWDINVDLPDFEIEVNDGPVPDDFSHKEEYLKGNFEKEEFTNHYTEYYHKDYAKIKLTTTKNTGKNLLLVADSYSDNMEKLIASHFDTTIIADGRYYEKTFGDSESKIKKMNIRKLIEENNITDVLILRGAYQTLFDYDGYELIW